MASQHRRLLLLFAALLATFSFSDAVFIGCFRFGKVSLKEQTTVSNADNAKDGAKDGSSACESVCNAAGLPIAAPIGGRCYCSPFIPDVEDLATELAAADCAADTPDNGVDDTTLVGLYYVHNVDGEGCALAPLPWTDTLWQDRDFKRDANFSSGEDGFTLDGTGTRLTLGVTQRLGACKASSKDKWAFGFYQLSAQPYGGLGAITAFYTSSNDLHQKSGDKWDEIDIEFVNALGPTYPDHGPNTVWLNVWSDGKNFSTLPQNAAAVKKAVGDASFVSSGQMATYSFDWQPDYIRWYLEGKPLLTSNRADWATNQFPSLPSNLIVSTWLPNGFCEYFGGCNASYGPYEAHMADIRRLVCGKESALAKLGTLPPHTSKQAPPPPPASPPPEDSTPALPTEGGSRLSPPPSGTHTGSSSSGGGKGNASASGSRSPPPQWRPIGLEGFSPSGAPASAAVVLPLAALALAATLAMLHL